MRCFIGRLWEVIVDYVAWHFSFIKWLRFALCQSRYTQVSGGVVRGVVWKLRQLQGQMLIFGRRGMEELLVCGIKSVRVNNKFHAGADFFYLTVQLIEELGDSLGTSTKIG